MSVITTPWATLESHVKKPTNGMKNTLLFSLLILSTISCKHGHGHEPHPNPASTFGMAAWIDYGTNPVSVQLRGSVFPSSSGPVQSPFDKAELSISDDISSGYKLLTTTTQKNTPLTGLKPGITYYVKAKGFLGDYSAESAPLLVVNDVVMPTAKLMPYDPQSRYFVSRAGLPVIQQKTDYVGNTSKVTTTIIDRAGASEVAAYMGVSAVPLFCRGWNVANQRAIFEINCSNKWGLVSYDPATKTYADIALPNEAEMWNYALAPDGQQLVYTDNKRPGLWYFDGRTNTQKLLDSRVTLYDLTWTTDSRYIWLTKPSADRVMVVQYDPTSAAQTNIFDEKNTLSGAQVSPNGKFVLYINNASGNGVLWLRNIETGVKRPVGSVNQYGWLNDGTFWAGYANTGIKPLPEREAFLWVFKP